MNKIQANADGRYGKLIWKALLVVWAIGLSWKLVTAAGEINILRYERWPLVGDTASYWLRDLAVLDHPPSVGHQFAMLSAAWDNSRDPIRTAFFALLKPSRVASVNGQLPYSAVCAALFFLTLAACLWNRTRSLLYAIAAPSVLLLAGVMFDPMYGLPSHIPDLPAAFLLGASLFALLTAEIPDRRRLFLSGAVLGLATLTRYHVWMYGAFLLFPIVLLLAFRRYRECGQRVSELLALPFAFVAGFALTAGWFVARWTTDAIAFYSVGGYALNSTVSTAMQTTGMKLLTQTMGLPLITALALICAGFFSTATRETRQLDLVDTCVILWAGVSCAVLILVILRVNDDVTQTFYVVPGLTLLFLAPFRVRGTPESHSPLTYFAFGLTIILPLSALAHHALLIRSETFLYPRPADVEIYAFNRELAKLVVENLPPDSERLPVIDSNFDYYARYIVPAVQLHHNKLVRFGNVFQIRQSQWKMAFSGIEETDAKAVMRDLDKRVDLFFALSDVTEPRAMPLLKDEYTRSLAQHVVREMERRSTDWQAVGEVASPFGEVLLFRNRRR